MKIYYIANIRIPTEKAHGIQVMKMCESFALSGVEVVLVVPNKKNPIKEDPIDFYGVKRIFKIIKLPVFDLGSSSAFLFILSSLTFYFSLYFFLLFKSRESSILYTRGEVALVLARLIPRKIFIWETHIKPGNMLRYEKALKRSSGIVTVTKYYADELIRDFGVLRENTLVAPDAVQLEDFIIDGNKGTFKKRLNLPSDTKIVLYTGHLYGWKGVDTLAEATPLLGEGITVVVVGGTDIDLVNFRAKYGDIKNLLIVGQKPYGEMKFYLNSADVLVIPNSAKSTTSQFYTSPLKFMASGVPIVASDLVSIREILNDDNSVFFNPDDSKDLAEKIQGLLDGPDKGNRISSKAFTEVNKYTWTKRGHNIVEFIKNKTKNGQY